VPPTLRNVPTYNDHDLLTSRKQQFAKADMTISK